MLDSIKLYRTLWLGKHLTVIFIIVVMYDENIAKVSRLFKLKGCKIYVKVFSTSYSRSFQFVFLCGIFSTKQLLCKVIRADQKHFRP